MSILVGGIVPKNLNLSSKYYAAVELVKKKTREAQETLTCWFTTADFIKESNIKPLTLDLEK